MIKQIKSLSIVLLLMLSLTACSAKEKESNAEVEQTQTEAVAEQTKEVAKLGEWITDYQQALELSKEHKKPILINFTGSDWCIWCKRLASEVFDKKEFTEYVKENFVLLKLDFPKNIAQSDEVKAKNEDLAKKFKITGFPTIVILDSSEKEIGRTGYQQGGAEKYIAHLQSFIQAK